MCGRFSLGRPTAAAERYCFVDWHELRIEPRFNIAPTQEIVTIVQQPLEEPSLRIATWGFRPFWMDAKRQPPINARAETLAESPVFREALATRRCLILADGFYEWRSVPGSGARAPIHFRLRAGAPFAFAGLWSPGRRGGPPSAAIVTTRPNDLVAPIHNRMPVILSAAHERLWLDPAVHAPEQLMPLLVPFPPALMEAYPVAPLVNAFQNEGPELIARI